MTIAHGTTNFDGARGRLLQVLRFLKDFNQLRNPAKRLVSDHEWVLWTRDIPEDSHVDWQGIATTPPTKADAEELDVLPDEPVLLRVRRPIVTYAPRPPIALGEWLLPGWEEPTRDATHRDEREAQNSEVGRFDDVPQLETAWVSWKAERDAWAPLEASHRRAGALYNRLFDLRTLLQRESETFQLVLCDGILNWHPENLNIHHPLLLKPVDLEFDEHLPELRLVETLSDTELYTAPLLDAPISDNTLLREAREDVAAGGIHPLEDLATTDFLERFVHRVSPSGRLLHSPIPTAGPSAPEVYRSPVVLLRKRTSSFGRFIVDALSHMQSTDLEIPLALARTVGVAPMSAGSDSPGTTAFGNQDPAILFALPANIEQLRIAQRLEQHGAVTVQGPPGTGKTHTIANLIGHFLSQGKTVLVTSQTSKALQVLRDKLPVPLQGLAVSVLDRDQVNRGQLESVIHAIADTISDTDPDSEERRVMSLEQHRSDLLSLLRQAQTDLLKAREAQYSEITFLGRSWSPSEACRWVVANVHDWIPTPVEPGRRLPISDHEVEELYALNASITPEDEGQVVTGLIDPQEILPWQAFEAIVARLNVLSGVETDKYSDCWLPGATTDPEQIHGVVGQVTSAVQFLGGASPWLLHVIEAGRLQTNMISLWEQLVDQVHATERQAAFYAEARVKYDPVVEPRAVAEDVLVTLAELEAHVSQGGSFGLAFPLLHRKWHAFRKSCRVNGQLPTTSEEFNAIRAVLALQRDRSHLVRTWNRLVGGLGGPIVEDASSAPESQYADHTADISSALTWYESAWTPCLKALEGIGLRWEQLEQRPPGAPADHRVLDNIKRSATTFQNAAVQERLALIEHLALHRQLNNMKDALRGARPTLVHRDLIAAIDGLNPIAYRSAFEELQRLHALAQSVERRRELLEGVLAVAPQWAHALQQRLGLHGESVPPGPARDAWLWAQLTQQLEAVTAMPFEEPQARIAALTEELESATAVLVAVRSWLRQIRRTTYDQNRALKELARVFKMIGKGTGRSAPRLQREARRLMGVSQEAVPVWIMPISRVVEQFIPGLTQFDVVIIDEASQADLLGLLPLYLGKQVVVVGDDEQVSPEGVGISEQRINQLRNTHLIGVPSAALYGVTTSVYDMAKIAFPGVVVLQEHFRCVPDIIQFSSHLSYEGKILPLRDASKVNLQPAVVPIRVETAQRDGDRNEEEALTVASLLVAAAEQPEYAGKTFGVVATAGHEQAVLIESILRQRLDVAEYEHRRLLCGEPPSFQGDERDVMFISMVHAPRLDGRPLPMLGDPGGRFKKRFNVAASRARDQEWVVHSVNPLHDLQPMDLRRQFLEFAYNPRSLAAAISQTTKRADSEFEKRVISRLMTAGYRVEPQLPVGSFRIDMVVRDAAGGTLAIECDGDRYHPVDKLPEDALRQATLERMGYTFVRLRGTEFFRNPERAMEPLFRKLGELGIVADAELVAADTSPTTSALVERVTARAEALRTEWAQETTSVHQPPTSPPAPTSTQRPRPVSPDTSISPGRPIAPVPPGIRNNLAMLPKAPVARIDPSERPSQLRLDSELVPTPAPTNPSVENVRAAVLGLVPPEGKIDREKLIVQVSVALGLPARGWLRRTVNHVISEALKERQLRVDEGWRNVWRYSSG